MSAHTHSAALDYRAGTSDLGGIRTGQQRAAQGLRARGSDQDRVQRAKDVMIRELDGSHATYLETCLRCGMCAEACHFYRATGEAKYIPIYKVQPLKRVYYRELAPMRTLRRMVTPDVTLKDLEEWQELVYDACTECGRCDLMCPMGIQISPMIGIMRRALAAADLLPAEIAAVAEEQKRNGSVLGVGRAEVVALAQQLTAKGVNVPLDKDQAALVLLTSAVDVKQFPASLEATATISKKRGSWWST